MTSHTHELNKDGTAALSMARFEGEDLTRMWPGVSGMLDALPHTWGHFTKEEIHAALLNGSFDLWGIGPAPKAIFFLMTAIACWPSKRVLQITWGAGTFTKDMKPLLDATFNNYAHMMGCEVIEIYGRVGWERVFSDIGFKKSQITLSRPVLKERVN